MVNHKIVITVAIRSFPTSFPQVNATTTLETYLSACVYSFFKKLPNYIPIAIRIANRDQFLQNFQLIIQN